MQIHLREYVNRLKNYSQELNNHALLIDQPWIFKSDKPDERCTLIFRRKDGELLITRNGKVEKGKWEYIAAMNSLLIEYKNGETRLYNSGFFDESVMVLKIDGTDKYQLFANEKKITSTIEKLMAQVERQYLSPSLFSDLTEEEMPNQQATKQKVKKQVERVESFLLVIGCGLLLLLLIWAIFQ